MRVKVEKDRVKVQVYKETGEEIVSMVTKIERLLVDTFRSDNILLLS
jgi:hypothetical protein